MSAVALLACPVCHLPLARGERAFRCDTGHAFDIARQGYVNLLLANHRRSQDPGDDRAMMVARTAFLAAGHYAPVADALAEAALVDAPATLVDVGCGEGYYLRRLRTRSGPSLSICGMDISRHAATAASRRDPDSLYVVASAYRMPFLDAIADVAMAQFAPTSAEELARVVRPGGLVVIGGPGPRHLFGLKSQVYDHPAEHDEASPLADAAGFTLIGQQRVRYDLALRHSADIANLLGMTPFYWAADAATQARLSVLQALDTEVDVIIHSYRRHGA